MKKPLSKTIKTFWGVGDMGFGIMTKLKDTGFSYFLTNICLFPIGVVGVILTITSTLDAISAPIIAFVIDLLKPMRWGRYRSWLLVIPIPVVICYMLIFTDVSADNMMLSAIVISAAYVLAHWLWNFAWNANIALIPVMASNSDERSLLSSRRATWNSAASLFSAYVGLYLALQIGKGIGNDKLGFIITAFIVSMLMLMGYWLHFRMSRGYEELPDRAKKTEKTETVKQKNKNKIPGKVLFKAIFTNPHLIVMIFAEFSKWMANFVALMTAAYICSYVYQDVTLIATYTMVSAIGQITGSFTSAFLCKKFTTRITTIVSFAGCGVGFIASARMPGIASFLVFVAVAYFFIGVLNSSTVALFADTSVYSEWKSGYNVSGTVMGLTNVSLKVAYVVRGLLVTAALASANFDAKMDPALATPELKAALVNVFGNIPGYFLVGSAILMLIAYRLTAKKVEAMQQEINERKLKKEAEGLC